MLVAGACLVLTLVAVLSAAWYCLALRYNRRHSQEVLRWLEIALGSQGQAAGIHWISRSRFKVPLRLRCGVFHRAWVIVDFRSREMPLRWLVSRVHGLCDTLTFQADLDLPPAFSLRVHNFRWCAHSIAKKAGKSSEWNIEECGRFVISTRLDWQREIPAAMVSLSRSDNQQFEEISFQRRSPHFSAKLPLDAIAPGAPRRDGMFETMREVAASASASLS